VLGRLTVGASGADGTEPRTNGLEEDEETDSAPLVDSIATAVNVYVCPGVSPDSIETVVELVVAVTPLLAVTRYVTTPDLPLYPVWVIVISAAPPAPTTLEIALGGSINFPPLA
jgi:hypothetical protein